MSLSTVTSGLQRLSGRLLLRIVLCGASVVLAALFGGAILSYALDRGLELPTAVRAVLLVAGVALLLVQVWKRLVRPLAAKPSIEDLARIAERQDPALQSRVISALQLERELQSGQALESPELIQAFVQDTAARFAEHDFARSLSLRPAQRPLAALGLSFAVVAAGALIHPTEASIWAKRWLGLQDTPWPRTHELVIQIQDLERYAPRVEGDRIILSVPERTSLQLQVTDARGNLPPEVDLLVQAEGERDPSRVSMGRPGEQPWFQHTFPPLLRSIEFTAEGGDDDDRRPIYVVRVAKAPRVQSFEAAYEYPSYTGLEPRTLQDANISAPEGTRVTLSFRANMPLAQFDLEFEEAGTLALTADAAGVFRHSFLVEENDFYTWRLRGTNEVRSPDVPRYVVTCEKDQPPRISATMPDATALTVTKEALIPLAGFARDDHGVTLVGLRYGMERGQLDAGGVDFGSEDFLKGSEVPSREARFFHALRIESLTRPAVAAGEGRAAEPARPFAEGDRFTFRFLAQDNRRTPADPEPHRAFGDFEFQVQVMTSIELQRELATRQVRLKSRVQEITELVRARIAESEAVLAGEGEGDAVARAALSRLEQEQRRITTELETSTRQFLRVFDGYLWNRVDPASVLTDRMIQSLSRAFRSGQTDQLFQIYGGAIAENEPLVNDSDLIGRLTGISRRFLRTATEQSPEAARRLARALLIEDAAESKALVREALAMQRDLERELQQLVLSLEAWEDYIDIIQGFRDLLQTQEGVQRRIQDATEKR